MQQKDVRIVVMRDGNIVVGTVSKSDSFALYLVNTSVIRTWGTEHGLGQLAIEGKQKATVLDACGSVTIPKQSIVFMINCTHPSWFK